VDKIIAGLIHWSTASHFLWCKLAYFFRYIDRGHGCRFGIILLFRVMSRGNAPRRRSVSSCLRTRGRLRYPEIEQRRPRPARRSISEAMSVMDTSKEALVRGRSPPWWRSTTSTPAAAWRGDVAPGRTVAVIDGQVLDQHTHVGEGRKRCYCRDDNSLGQG